MYRFWHNRALIQINHAPFCVAGGTHQPYQDSTRAGSQCQEAYRTNITQLIYLSFLIPDRLNPITTGVGKVADAKGGFFLDIYITPLEAVVTTEFIIVNNLRKKSS